MYAVVVEFTLHAERAAEFQEMMVANARRSRSEEPGCRQFDICLDPDAPEKVFLYELYDDAAAFAAHLESKHFKEFDAASAPCVAAKSVRTFRQVIQ